MLPRRKSAAFLVLFALPVLGLYAQADPREAWYGFGSPQVLSESSVIAGSQWDDPAVRSFGEVMRSGFTAWVYAVLKNTLTMYFNGVVIRSTWAFPTPETIQRAFSEPWKWEDTDGFMVNHLGHPIQGSVYFNAARVNGFGFYGSLFFSALGSAMWEAVHERQRPSINDFLVTTPTGMSLGEMTFRLYAQALAAGVPTFLAALFNPAAGVHHLITGWEPLQTENNIYDSRFFVSAAFGHTDHTVSDANGPREMFRHSGPFADFGFGIVYGDPFTQGTWVPFRHFEFHASFGMDAVFQNHYRLFSDGYLFSFSPLHTEAQALSHGLSLFYDFASLGALDMYYASINMYSNALGWTVKYRHLFPRNVALRSRAHAAFTFLGASSYYNPDRGRALLNYGYGFSLRHLSTLDLGRRIRLDLHNFAYFLWHYPGTASNAATFMPPETTSISEGFVWWQFHDLTFSYLLTERISLGATLSFATERGSFGAFPSTSVNHWAVRTFVAWNGQNIR